MLDIDDTDDPVLGQQELAPFNAHDDSTCFQPIHVFDSLSGKPVLSLLRLGKRPSGEEVAKVLRHVIRRIRKHWPRVDILERGDSHYCSEPALALLERLGCDYIIGFAINSKPLEIAAPSRWQANQFRLFLHVGAYWLLHSLRQAAPKPLCWRGATFETIRRVFVKVAVRFEELKGKIKLAFPASYPQAAMLAMMTGTITIGGP